MYTIHINYSVGTAARCSLCILGIETKIGDSYSFSDNTILHQSTIRPEVTHEAESIVYLLNLMVTVYQSGASEYGYNIAMLLGTFAGNWHQYQRSD